MSGDTDDNEVAQVLLKSIAVTKYKLDTSYARGKEIKEREAGWSCGFNWNIDTTDSELDELRIFILLNLYRRNDNFSIVRLHTTTTYKVSKGLSFNMKYSVLVDLCNQVLGQTQGMWRVKVHAAVTLGSDCKASRTRCAVSESTPSIGGNIPKTPMGSGCSQARLV